MHALFFFIAFFYLEAEKNVWSEITFSTNFFFSSWLENLFNINLSLISYQRVCNKIMFLFSPSLRKLQNLSINGIKKNRRY